MIALLVPFAALSAVATFQALWVAKVPLPRARILALVATGLLVQVAVALSFLPTSLYVNGGIVAIVAYAVSYAFQIVPTDPHFLRTARRALLLASSLGIVLLASAPWR